MTHASERGAKSGGEERWGVEVRGDVPVPPELDESIIRQCPRGAEREALVERWVRMARGNSMKVQVVARESVAQVLEECLASHQVDKLLLNAPQWETSLGLSEFFAGKGLQVTRWGDPGSRDIAFGCDAAVTECRGGLADSGSILVWSTPEFGRSSTLVTPVHVVLMKASQILPDLVDALELVPRAGEMPSNVVVINGPSKTADIENKLITGVHGPKYLYVILVEGI
ncbi:MAG TPA: lactate utilization protein [Phycisphaerae bacterium]